VSLRACVAVAAAELLRPADEGTLRLLYFTMFVRFFLFLFRFLTACFLLRVFIIIITTTTTPVIVFALSLSIYLSTSPLNSQAFCFGPNSF
jgi:hypothetical protein